MKGVYSALVGLTLGSLLGVLQAYWNCLSRPEWRETVSGGASAEPLSVPGKGERAPDVPLLYPDEPHLVIDNPLHRFGVMPSDATGRHEFLLTNNGGAPLTLEVERTTCKCTGAKVGQSSLAPGESTQVALDWSTQGFDEEFRHGATLKTNDPTQPSVILTIQGRVTNVVRTVPGSLHIERMSVQETVEHRVRMYSYRGDPLSLEKMDWTDSELADRFHVEVRELGPDELHEEKDAQQGYELLLRVLPGLPMGAFKQSLRITTSYADVNNLEIPISGTCTSDISIMGVGFHADTQVLHWGVVEAAKGDTRELLAIVRGPHRESVQLEQTTSDPPQVFRVEVGQPEPFNHGIVVKVPLKIHIDPGHDPVSRLAGNSPANLGRIELRTNHPVTPTISILVRFGIR